MEYLEAISGKEKTPVLIDRYVADPELKEHILFFESAFPKYVIAVEDLICEDNQVVIRAHGKGVHEGNLMNIPPTGKAVNVPFIAIYQIKDEKIVKSWLVTDRMVMMEQLGLMQSAN